VKNKDYNIVYNIVITSVRG